MVGRHIRENIMLSTYLYPLWLRINYILLSPVPFVKRSGLNTNYRMRW